MKRHLLLLEDDPNFGFVLQEHLESNGFRVRLHVNGEDGLAAIKKERFDLCLVDVMMPKKDGFTFARQLRTKDSSTPIIFLTAKSLKEDRIEGFKAGGDDYVTKPFSMEELFLRIHAVLHRTTNTAMPTMNAGPVKIGKFTFDESKQVLSLKNVRHSLTAREAQLLSLLCTKKNGVVPRTDILKTLWDDDTYYNGRSLDVFISRLRKLLAGDPSVEIKSVHGKGYKLTAGK
jgi:two-component system response regulator VicR